MRLTRFEQTLLPAQPRDGGSRYNYSGGSPLGLAGAGKTTAPLYLYIANPFLSDRPERPGAEVWELFVNCSGNRFPR